ARDRLQVVYVDTVKGHETSPAKPDIGSRRPLLRTAIGRALLYALHEVERAMVLQRLQAAMPAEWDAFGQKVGEARAEIDSREFCIAFGEWQPTLAAV